MKRKSNRPERLVHKIVEQLKAARLAQGISHEELAEKTGVSRPAISHLESKKRRPSLLMAFKLAEGLNKELSELVRIAEETEKR